MSDLKPGRTLDALVAEKVTPSLRSVGPQSKTGVCLAALKAVGHSS